MGEVTAALRGQGISAGVDKLASSVVFTIQRENQQWTISLTGDGKQLSADFSSPSSAHYAQAQGAPAQEWVLDQAMKLVDKMING
ncbi:MAG: hypothetical protein ACRDKE_09270 [Solirubrobacterales bacterium]